MATDKHGQMIRGFYKEFKSIFDNSSQAIYLYLDDSHKLCNKKFASLLGYNSPKEWAAVDYSFTGAFVDPKSQHALINAYSNAMGKSIGSAISVTWLKKDDKKVNTKVILVPVAYKGHLMALHFVSK